MIPLRDENPSRSVPLVTSILIVLNVVAFVYELSLGPELRGFVFEWGIMPERLTLAIRDGVEPAIIPASTFVTSMFLHGGWAHLVGNMWYLWIFGDNVEDRLGSVGFTLFYFTAGIAAALVHYLSDPLSSLPTVGASGAIAGVLGAYAVAYPRARVITLIPFFPFFQIVPLPALFVLGLWFVFQFVSGTLFHAGGVSGGGVAWWAHIGGFAFGALVMAVFGRPRTPRRSEVWAEH